MAAHTIQFTQEQARALSGVTPEAWRHWRSVVPYLAGKRGKAARFSIGDIVALSILQHAVHDLGISVGRLAKGFDDLFGKLVAMTPSALADRVAVVGPSAALVLDVQDLPVLPQQIALSVACRPIVERLASTTFPAIADVQPPLPFAPRVVGGAR